MFSQTWKKYLPVIIILLKRSVQEPQTLNVNHTDFERAAGGRKLKFSFTNLQLNKGRINTDAKHAAVALELAVVLQEDRFTNGFISNQNFEFALNNDFKLTIKNTTPPAEPVEETAETEETSL